MSIAHINSHGAFLRAALCIFAFMFLSAAHAEGKDSIICKDIVDSQIKAFIAKDYETAYSFAAPMIKSMYPKVDGFVAMVKRGYMPVYSPQTYSFGRMNERDGNRYQEVLLTDQQGQNWVAIYTLTKFDGDWKINGVLLKRSAARPT